MASVTGIDPLSLALAAGAGLLSFLSPCVLPLVPVYLSYLAGVAAGARQARLLEHAFLFVLGFTLVFVLLGLSATWLGRFLLLRQALLRRLAGLVVFTLGLHTGGILRLPVLDRVWRPFSSGVGSGRGPHESGPPGEAGTSPRKSAGAGGGKGVLAAFLLGVSFSAGWTPCVGPLLGSILIYAGTAETAARGALLLALYAGGLGLPFLAAAAALDRLAPLLGFLRRHALLAERVSGLLLAALGVALSFDWWPLFSG
ncbi:MAG: cytochrome c biogenesis protein CcdA [Bacillota bacterium]|nr:cytochrome c biogenesis protein CcdA [Bacillota bacterium]